ncbi:MAG TPA: TAXI family TRAP transporter solute-binding subunit [Jatrophihabitantaceae bacterium]|nr:TAXI family TRAP transporter solute-binding subunit [Jatrophihabitantaceae bacterium]
MTIARRTLLRTAAAGALAAPLLSCGSSVAGTLRIAAGRPGGVFERFGRQLAAELGRHHPDLRISFAPVADDSAALDAVQAGEAELAIAQLDMVAERQTGRIRALGRVFENYAQLMVLTDGPIRGIDDLPGHTVHLGEATGPSALLGKRILDCVPRPLEVRHTFAPFDVAVADTLAGAAAGLLWCGEVAPSFTAGVTKLRLVDLAATLQSLIAYYASFYDSILVPSGVYGASNVVHTIGCPALLVCPQQLTAELATAVVQVLLAQARLLTAATSGSQFVDARSLIATSPIPLHDAVADVYRADHG